MAVVSALPAIAQRNASIRYPDLSEIICSTSIGTMEEPVASIIEEIIYVAVGEFKKCKSTLIYGLQNSGGKRICIIHVLVPAQMIPLMGTKFPANKLKEEEVRAYRELERQNMHKLLDEYLSACRQVGARVDKLHIESDSIEKGIVELISRHEIRKLVMGAAEDKHFSRKMVDIRSKKAIYVRLQAPVSCHIQFICKGKLIYTRKGSSHGAQVQAVPSSPQASLNTEAVQLGNWRSRSIAVPQSNGASLSHPAPDFYRRARSAHISNSVGSTSDLYSPDTVGLPTLSRFYTEGIYDECDGSSRRSPSEHSASSSSCSFSGPNDGASTSYGRSVVSENDLRKEDYHRSSPPSVLDGTDDNLYDQLERAMTEATTARRIAFEEAIKRGKAEKDAIDAVRKAKASESLYTEELEQKKYIEEALEEETYRLGNMKNQLDQVMEELRISQHQKANLETQIEKSDQMVKELEQKILSAVELLQNYKNERDDLKMQRDNAVRQAEELRRRQVEDSSPSMPRLCSDFSFQEVEEATNNFDPSLKIGEGGYGTIYKGLLRHTEVAIKMLNSHSSQGPLEFQQEVDVLSKIRHPNLVTLVGVCPEAWILIYEYLPNGSLEDRLSCRDNSPPLSWITRLRIATELCSVLMFLHSSEPHSIIHGDLKPANVLLDANYVCKLGDFGICRLLHRDGQSIGDSTHICRTEPKGTFAYMDPEFVSTGELTIKSDVYSFGVILLRLLTGRSAMGIAKEVQYGLDNGNMKSLLDPLAGDWPFVQAEQLARLALRCCDGNRRRRPDLETDVWRVLEPMRAACGGSSSTFRLGSEEHFKPPSYFNCPIFLEVMQDPHVAADGFTYEAEAIKGWLDIGHDTSPMTNHKLDHCNLVPNLALRSAIREWLQHL